MQLKDFHKENFPQGQMWKLKGENGVGKTTLLKKIQNNASFLGFSHIVLAPQPMLLALGHLTPKHLLALIQEQQEVSKTLIEIKKLDQSGLFNLQPFFETPIKNLSGGENQLLKLFICLSIKADLYLLDEPSTHLDYKKKEQLKTFLHQFKREHKRILIVDHSLNLDHREIDKNLELTRDLSQNIL